MTDLKAHYTKLLALHGPSPQAVQWSSSETQLARFDVLLQDLQSQDRIIDLGCGLGKLLSHLRETRGHSSDYLGLDFVPEFIEFATQHNIHDKQAAFKAFNVLSDDIPTGYDYIVQSGMFNNLMEDNWGFITQTLQKMYAATNRMIVFNALSTYVDYQDEGLYYTDPLKLFDYCKRHIGAKVCLRHDYLVKENSIPFEFTISISK